ncbi:hypothetical protein CD30_13740 [Ureibacillus massiliensis 4400831 = CIP 108448 = CCUG 49529]|uniref:GtrA/DPMS transmembrane domain-containing protein n=1 Tax=Ureibacillus massiliensis 4400831 = CIP 108448 = CCUG 49529 TaxID=1211035 RepID=A0A0A3J2S7_9BACL|nr:GtrA family protein [Ureibacillus massiliensis]KGR90035.1 hypothetical protein CD30_13740 [Ureibacillus massiliensis 4400831 = CIP 108448 = CCUG 49529]
MKQGKDQGTLLTRFMNKEFIRFLFVGIFNTVSTYVSYLILLPFLNYNLAYLISYLSGIIISFLLNTKYVFKVDISFKKAIKYPLVYGIQYLLNVVILNLLVGNNLINEVLAPIIVIIISVPITFFLSKYILKR